MNDKAAKQFIHYISATIDSEIGNEIAPSPFLSILSDSSTDTAAVEEEIVYLMYMFQGKSIVRFIDMVPVKDGIAAGILDAIWKALENVGLLKENDVTRLVGFGGDGASVMMGCNNGVAAL